MKAARALSILVLAALAVSACQALPPPAPAPMPTVAPQAAAVYIPHLENGAAAWKSAQCGACHGPVALGGIGPQLAATKLPYTQFLQVVRSAVAPMPAYDEAALPSQTVYDIYAWVRTQLPPAQVVGRPQRHHRRGLLPQHTQSSAIDAYRSGLWRGDRPRDSRGTRQLLSS